MSDILTATPAETCASTSVTSDSAVSQSISTPRFIGPGCMTTASELRRASRSRVRPYVAQNSCSDGSSGSGWRACGSAVPQQVRFGAERTLRLRGVDQPLARLETRRLRRDVDDVRRQSFRSDLERHACPGRVLVEEVDDGSSAERRYLLDFSFVA